MNHHLVYDYDINMPDHTIWLQGLDGDGLIGTKTLVRLSKNCAMIKGNISIRMSCEGGCVASALGIYDLLHERNGHVTITIEGMAESAACVIFQSADHRVMMPHSYLMIHKGTANPEDMSPESLRTFVEWSEKMDQFMEDIFVQKMYLKGSKCDTEAKARMTLRTMMAGDWYIGANEAVELGLADEVYER